MLIVQSCRITNKSPFIFELIFEKNQERISQNHAILFQVRGNIFIFKTFKSEQFSDWKIEKFGWKLKLFKIREFDNFKLKALQWCKIFN